MNDRLAVLLAVVATTAFTLAAADRARYLLVLKPDVQSERSLVEAVQTLGGEVESRADGRIVISAPPGTIGSLTAHPAVKYVQPIGAGAPELPVAAPHQPVQGNAMTWTSGEYRYDGAGNVISIGTAGVPGTQGHRTYGYDPVSRLTRAGGGAAAPTYEYEYDAYGNRAAYSLNQQRVSVPVVAATNRLSDATYDTVGNQLARGATAATFDGFGMMTSYRFDGVNAETFVYTANDERIGVLRGTEWTWSLRGPGGRVLRQYRSSAANTNAPWIWLEDFVHRGSLPLGSERVPAEGGRRHYHLDHLGSPRLVTSGTGSVISEHDFLPFGEEKTPVDQQLARGFDREQPHRYTGHERDFDTAAPNATSAYVDYMHARYYTARTGRFLSVDPGRADLKKPQSWNRYSYTLNNPINNTDPDGRETNPVTGQSYILDSQILVSKSNPRKGFFGMVRRYADGSPKKHGGNDIKAPRGTPVFAPVTGTVIQSGWAGGDGGYVLRIRRANDEDGKAVYIHISHLNGEPTVKVGDQVVEGQANIAEVGNTGNAKNDDPHAHTAVMVGGQTGDHQVDPQQWFRDHPSNSQADEKVEAPCEPNEKC